MKISYLCAPTQMFFLDLSLKWVNKSPHPSIYPRMVTRSRPR